MTIIGFVSSSKIEETMGVEECCLPIGFAKDGSQTTQWENCQLILVDDNNFSESEIQCCGQSIDAILIQHNTSIENWDSQRKWVKELGWEPKDSKDGFSHIPGNFFWEKIKELLTQANPQEKADIIKSLINKYVPAEAFRALDIEAARMIIKVMQGSESDSATSDLREYLKCANKRAFDILNPEKQNEPDSARETYK